KSTAHQILANRIAEQKKRRNKDLNAHVKNAGKGETCEESNHCSSNPCKNDGTCEEDGTGFKCICKGPWKGETCEESE
ncbi:hypothetical protein AVEN_234715-1, partial [Araneus ventricosus]